MGGRRASCAVAAGLVLGGCSFVTVRRPPASPPPAGAPLECTQSPAAPVLDTVGAIVTPLAGLGAYGMCTFMQAQQSWASQPQNLRCGTFLWVTIGATAAYTGSAVYGFHETGACRRLAAQVAPQEDQVEQVPPLPPHLAPPPPR
ncbi:MAG TPA: hypothetical protein VLU43_00035 [Anaeromyxobacteraceae bacterium]|nr:hypothetical protein [Anaeromyxobacteraceae bacterium]